MPKHTPFTLALMRKNAAAGKRQTLTPEIDSYQLAHDRRLRPGRKDWRTERTASAYAVTVAPKPKASDDRRNRGQGSRLDRWGQIVGQQDDTQTRRPLMVRSQAIRPPVQRDYQGAKDGGASEATGEAMRERLAPPTPVTAAYGEPMTLHGLGYHGPGY